VLIDEVLPVWHKRELHRRRTDADQAELLRAAGELTWDEVAAFRVLMRVRAGGRRLDGATVMAGMVRMGFTELARGSREIVYGTIGRPWTPGGGLLPIAGPDLVSSFVDFDEPGFAKMAFNFRVDDSPDDGRELTTETRVFLTNASARRAFGAYWLVVRPFSGWIRREWLAGITRRAARTGPTPRG
jgi:hypothetical protein